MYIVMCVNYISVKLGEKIFKKFFEITNIWVLFCFLKKEIGFHESENMRN